MTTKGAVLLLSCGLLIMLLPADTRAQQMPVSAKASDGSPHVTCQGDRLTIAANNATLGSILSAVRACIGVEIDMPDAAAEELSFVQLGPGPAREVLDALLGSTQFNYAIQSSSSEPGKISSILLMARVKAGEDSQSSGMPASAEFTMTPARQTWLASVRALKASAEDARPRIVGTDPVTLSAPDDVRRIQASHDATVADASATDSIQPSKEAVTAKPSGVDVQQAAVPSEVVSAVSTPTPASELQNKIGEMQQLFEQRKKMMTDLAATPAQK